MKLLLDANIVIAIQKAEPAVVDRLRSHRRRDVGLSAIVLHELYFGAFKSDLIDYNLAEIERLRLPVVPFDAADAEAAGRLRAALRQSGTPIGPYDVMIAAQALARGVRLVTRNLGEFKRIPALALEAW